MEDLVRKILRHLSDRERALNSAPEGVPFAMEIHGLLEDIQSMAMKEGILPTEVWKECRFCNEDGTSKSNKGSLTELCKVCGGTRKLFDRLEW